MCPRGFGKTEFSSTFIHQCGRALADPLQRGFEATKLLRLRNEFQNARKIGLLKFVEPTAKSVLLGLGADPLAFGIVRDFAIGETSDSMESDQVH